MVSAKNMSAVCAPPQIMLCHHLFCLQFPNLKIDKVRQGGLRGVVATKDFKEGQVLAHIPNKCTVDVGHYTLPGAVRL